MPEPTVRVLEEQIFYPARVVEVEHNGLWWPGTQSAWRLCDDARGWMAKVRWTEQHDWGDLAPTTRWSRRTGCACPPSKQPRRCGSSNGPSPDKETAAAALGAQEPAFSGGNVTALSRT